MFRNRTYPAEANSPHSFDAVGARLDGEVAEFDGGGAIFPKPPGGGSIPVLPLVRFLFNRDDSPPSFFYTLTN